MIRSVGSLCFNVVDEISNGFISVVIFKISVMFVMLEFSVLFMVVFILLFVEVMVEIIILGVEDFIVIIVSLIIIGEMLMFFVNVEVLYINWLVF